MASKKYQSGLSLIELMISLLLSAVLLLGLLQIFQGNKVSNSLQRAFSRVQETGRVATELIARDIRMADYWGCLPASSSIVNHLDPDDDDYESKAGDHDFLGDSVDGIEDADGTDVVGGHTLITNTDALILRTSSDACGGLGRPTTGNGAALHLAPGCVAPTGPLGLGDIAIITNCEGGELFSITNIQNGSGGDSDKKTAVHNGGTCNASPDCVDNINHTFSQDYEEDARILAPVKKTYFVADGTNGNPSLFLKENAADAIELVEGVEDMQIMYGEDTDDDGAIEEYNDLDAVTDKDKILSIRVVLSVNEPQGQVTKTFTATSSVRNRTL